MKLTPATAIGTRVYCDAPYSHDRGFGTITNLRIFNSCADYFTVEMNSRKFRYPTVREFESVSHRVWYTATDWVEHLRDLLSDAEHEVRAEASERGERAERAERNS